MSVNVFTCVWAGVNVNIKVNNLPVLSIQDMCVLVSPPFVTCLRLRVFYKTGCPVPCFAQQTAAAAASCIRISVWACFSCCSM